MYNRRMAAVAAPLMTILFAAGMLRAQIMETGQFELGADGVATVPIRLDTIQDQVAGIQGRLLFDPSRIDRVAISVGPGQPVSFVASSHEPEPGELRFVLYSIDATLLTDQPVLLCHIEADPRRNDKGFDSVMVSDLEQIATADLQTHEPTRYANVPIVMPPRAAADRLWLDY